MINIFFLILIFTSAQAFTFNNNFGASFTSNRVKIYIDGDTTCSKSDMTVYELGDYIKVAIDQFWNKVPTSNLTLEFGGFSDPNDNINHGQLCAPTDENCIEEAAGTVIAPVNNIIIACNDLEENFGGSNVLAVTIPNNFSGRSIKGSVIIINDSSTAFGNLSRRDKIGVIAHEIGHAVGLGHTEDKSALMFYRTVDLRRTLGQDDIDGISYLYPKKFDGCGLYGGTISTKTPPSNQMWQMFIGIIVVVSLARLKKLLNRSQARPST